MKKGIIIIVLITLSLILFRPPKIKATTKENWGLELTPIPRMNVYDAQTMNQITVRSQVIASQTSGSTYEKEWNVWEIGEKTYGANGYMWEFPSQLEHTPNYLYSYQLGMCATKSLSSATIELFAGQYGSKVNTDIYSQVSLNSMNSQVFPDWNANNCYILYGYYVPSNDTAWSHMRIYSPNSVISNLGVYVFSFDIEPVGIWTSGIKDIIDNSGFASADSVEQVQESVDRVEEAITGDYNYNDTPSEELEGKEELDNLKEKEEELLGNLDFSGAENIEITIEPETASFIWQIVDSLRSMSGKIVLLITSILGLGIIKMILNR